MTASIRLALPFMTAGVAQGFSANNILNLLTASGLGVNRAKGLAVIKVLRTPFGAPSITKAQGNPYGLDPGLFRAAPYPTSRNYTYVYKVQGVDTSSGIFTTKYISVTSDKLLTSDHAQSIAQTILYTADGMPYLADESYSLETVKISPTFNAP